MNKNILKFVFTFFLINFNLLAYANDFFSALDAYRLKDYQKSIAILEPLSESGNANALALLGRMYYRGDGVIKDTAKALKLLNEARDKGNAVANWDLGQIYELGLGTPPDLGNALLLYKNYLLKSTSPNAIEIAAKSIDRVEEKLKNAQATSKTFEQSNIVQQELAAKKKELEIRQRELLVKDTELKQKEIKNLETIQNNYSLSVDSKKILTNPLDIEKNQASEVKNSIQEFILDETLYAKTQQFLEIYKKQIEQDQKLQKLTKELWDNFSKFRNNKIETNQGLSNIIELSREILQYCINKNNYACQLASADALYLGARHEPSGSDKFTSMFEKSLILYEDLAIKNSPQALRSLANFYMYNNISYYLNPLYNGKEFLQSKFITPNKLKAYEIQKSLVKSGYMEACYGDTQRLMLDLNPGNKGFYLVSAEAIACHKNAKATNQNEEARIWYENVIERQKITEEHLQWVKDVPYAVEITCEIQYGGAINVNNCFAGKRTNTAIQKTYKDGTTKNYSMNNGWCQCNEIIFEENRTKLTTNIVKNSYITAQLAGENLKLVMTVFEQGSRKQVFKQAITNQFEMVKFVSK